MSPARKEKKKETYQQQFLLVFSRPLALSSETPQTVEVLVTEVEPPPPSPGPCLSPVKPWREAR